MALINCPECKTEVSSIAVSCPYCGFGIKNHFDKIEKAVLEVERKKMLAVQKQKRIRTLKKVIPIAIIISAVVVGIIINTSMLSKRKTFNSESEMLAYLTSCKYWELDSDYRKEWLAFNIDGLGEEVVSTEHYPSGKHYTDHRGEDVVLHPDRGTFDLLYSKYIILSSGDIVEGSNNGHDVYEKRNMTPPFEIPVNVLNIEINSADLDTGGNFTGKYTVTNTGTQTYQFIKLETVLTADDKSKVTLEDDYEIVETENDFILPPGKSGHADAFLHDAPKNVKNCTVRIKEFSTKTDF